MTVALMMHDGSEEKKDRLERATRRTYYLAKQMLSRSPHAGQWEQSADALPDALYRYLQFAKEITSGSARRFYNVASFRLRQLLLDLAHCHLGLHGAEFDQHSGPVGEAVARSVGPGDRMSSLDEWLLFHRLTASVPEHEPMWPRGGVDTLEGWVVLHRLVGTPPPEELETFGLIWYQGLTQEEAADMLGVSAKSVECWWQAARLALARRIGTDPPAPMHE
jgi:hypothetical protein